jgi:hypothetical protein
MPRPESYGRSSQVSGLNLKIEALAIETILLQPDSFHASLDGTESLRMLKPQNAQAIT